MKMMPSRLLGMLRLSRRLKPCICQRWTSTGNISSIREVREQLIKIVGRADIVGSSAAGDTSWTPLVRGSQDELPDRAMQDSYQEAVIPLTDPLNRERYITFQRGIRFGRVLEDLDTFAGFICYNHYKDPALKPTERAPIGIVTALVDRLSLHSHAVSPFHDIKMSGHVSWAGRSSMEVTMDMHQQMNNKWQKILRATFVMVARNPVTSKAAVINRLVPNGAEEEAIFKKGEETKLLRQEEAKRGLLRRPPDVHEIDHLHNIFRETIDERSGTFKVRVKPEGTEWMENTLLKNMIMCHPEQRNIHNKVFGGFLMRQAMELAWANVAKYSGKRPVLTVVDDIVFKKSVEIGALLMMSSQIVYTDKSKIQVKVHAEVLDISTGARETTNDFHFTFDSLDENLPRVIPKSYAENMLYLDGKRHYES